jgi:predicted transcriptional regulator
MANAINLVVAEEALKQVTQLSTRLAKADKALLAISKSAVIASNSLSKITTPKGLDALTKTNAGLNAELEKQSQIIKSLQASITQLQAVKKQKAQTDVQEAVNQGILNSNAKQAAVIQSTLAGAYKKLAAEQAKSATAVQNLVSRGKLATQTQRQYNKELKVAQADFNKLNARVLAADRAVGRFNRKLLQT